MQVNQAVLALDRMHASFTGSHGLMRNQWKGYILRVPAEEISGSAYVSWTINCLYTVCTLLYDTPRHKKHKKPIIWWPEGLAGLSAVAVQSAHEHALRRMLTSSRVAMPRLVAEQYSKHDAWLLGGPL